MNTKRTVSFLLVLVMIGTAFLAVSCEKKGYANVHIKFVTTLDENGEKLPEEKVIGETTVKVEGTQSNPPTVLQAAQTALAELSYEEGYETTSDGYSIARIKTYEEHDEVDATTGYYTYWVAYVDGERKSGGRQSAIPVYDQSEVVFKYISDSTPREDVGTSNDTGN
ncbi:MAG: hypothetical protein IJT70_01710 [Clostridia bacterium]|nr:hypothetical protein [Clostridia bacterium]